MPIPPVVVDIAPQPVAAELAQTLLTSCTEAVSVTECVVAADTADAEAPSAVAIVSWDTELTVRIEVGIRRDDRSRWQERELVFYEADAPEERWKSVGFAIATMVGEVRAFEGQIETSPVTPAEKDAEPPPKKNASPARVTPERRRTRGSARAHEPDSMPTQLGAFALVGSALEHAPPAAGAGLELAIAPGTRSFFLRARGEYARSLGAFEPAPQQRLSAGFLTLGLGVSYELFSGSDFFLRPSLGLEARLQRLDVTVKTPADEQTSGRWVLGGAARVRLVFPADTFVCGFIGGAASLWAGSTDVHVFDVPAASRSSLSGDAELGVGLRWR
jgi:hypothetical protein